MDLDPPPDHFVYFVRTTDDPVPIPNSSAEASEQLQEYFEIGVVAGHSLEMLEQLLNQVAERLYTVVRSYCGWAESLEGLRIGD